MEFIAQSLDDIVASLKPLTVEWKDETANRVIDRLKRLPVKKVYTVDDVKALLGIGLLEAMAKEANRKPHWSAVLVEAGIALRGLFIIDPQGIVRQITINDLPIGRSVDETLRLVKALQYVEIHGEVWPAN